jgi:hypothetical protein
MGLFKKKSDPISQRAQALNDQIAALEEEIRRLSTLPQPVNSAPSTPSPPVKNSEPAPNSPFAAPPPTKPHVSSAASPFSAPSAPARQQPKLRSTTLPYSQSHAPAPIVSAASPVLKDEPVFEQVHQTSIKNDEEPPGPEHVNELGVRKYGAAAIWHRMKTHFRGPPPANPKLVNYLAAGSIQGLRPLRYEKRVARNRFLVLAGLLFLLLWGLIAILIKHH